MKTTKIFSFIAALLAMRMVLSACGAASGTPSATQAVSQSADTQPAAATEKAADPVTITYCNFNSSGGNEETLAKMVEAFEASHPDIKVDVETIGYDDYFTQMQTRVAGGTAPDCYELNIENFAAYANKGLLAEISGVDVSGLNDTALNAFCVNGKQYGLPESFSNVVLIYNKDLFEQAGITEEPKTWDEFKDVCQKLKDAGITPMTMDDAYATCVIGYHLARLVGEDKVKEIVTEGEWDDPAVLQMAQDIEELASNGYYSEMVGSNVWPAGQNTELALGTAAMYLNGSWLPNEVKEMAGPDFHWGCFAYPALTDGANGIETNNFGAQVFGINKDTKLAKEAFDLITFLTKGEYDQKLADETVGIPADTTNTEWPAMVECAKPVIEQSTNRFTWACGVESNVDMTPVIKENFIKLMAGSITADEFVSTMQDAAK